MKNKGTFFDTLNNRLTEAEEIAEKGFRRWETESPDNFIEYLDASSYKGMIAGKRKALELYKNHFGYNLPEEYLEAVGNIETRDKLNEYIENARQRQLAVEQNLSPYFTDKGTVKTVALSFAGGAVETLSDPISLLVNRISPDGFVWDVITNIGEYAWDIYSLYGRNMFTDFRKEDAVNIGASAVTTFALDKGGKILTKKLASLDKAVEDSTNIPEVIKKDLKTKGFDSVANMKEIYDVVKKQEYGEPQFDYGETTEKALDNYLNYASKLNKKYQSENAKLRINFENEQLKKMGLDPTSNTEEVIKARKNIKYGRKTNINIEKQLDITVKPLVQELKLNTDQILSQYARETFGVEGYEFGDTLYHMTKNMNGEDFINQVKGLGTVSNQYGDDSLAKTMTKRVEEWARIEEGYSKADHSKKSFILDKFYQKNVVMEDLRNAYETGDTEYIMTQVAPFVGEEVELTKAQAEAVGLAFDETKINKTMRIDSGGYDDFKVELDSFKSKVNEKIKEKKVINKEEFAKKSKLLKEEYDTKIKAIRETKESISGERDIKNSRSEVFRNNRDEILKEEYDSYIANKEVIRKDYSEKSKIKKDEKNTLIKELNNQINELKKQKTAEINAIQNNSKLYDPDKLPEARRISKKFDKKIRDIEEQKRKIGKELATELETLKKEQNIKIEKLDKGNEKLNKLFSKETRKYNSYAKEELNRKDKNIRRNADKEIKELKEEYQKKLKKLAKESDNKYIKLKEELENINERNYKRFYKKFKNFQNEFEEITRLRDMIENYGKYENTNTYHIKEKPFEVTRALYYDIARTTREAKKGDNYIEYATPYSIAEKWGNKAKSNSLVGNDSIDLNIKENTFFENYSKIFEGREREVYEIVSDVYATLAERKSGLEDILEFTGDLKVDKRRYSKGLSLEKKYKLTGLNQDIRKKMEEQLSGIKQEVGIQRQYKPNLWVDPHDQRLNSGMARSSVKSFLNYKFLGSFNYIREFLQNNFKITTGARKLGWRKKYSLINSMIVDPIKVHIQLAKNARNITEHTIDTISDPIIRRRAEIFAERRIANDIIWNDPTNFGIGAKTARGVQRTLKKAGDTLAVGQLISDVHRQSNAEWASINYLKDIFPNMKKEKILKTPELRTILETNGILDDKSLNDIFTRIKDMSDEELMKLVWQGKRPDNMVDYKIQSLFNQFADVMAREFNAFKKVGGKNIFETNGFVSDMMMLYKRYSMGALDNFTRNLLNYYDNDGILRKRFDFAGDFKANYKQIFKGFSTNNFLDFGKMAVGTSLLYTGIKWTHGKLSGSTEDELAEAKFEALFSEGEVLPFVLDSLQSAALDMTGVGLVLGGTTVWGGFQNTSIARAKRAFTSNKLGKEEALMWWLTTTLITPEFMSRGIDNIKFEKNIATRLTTSSKAEQRIWKYKYRRLAEIDQVRGNLPVEKLIGFASPVNWLAFFKKNPEKAYEVTGSDENMNKDVVIAGAYGITSIAEEFSEIASLQEILQDDRPEYKETQLKILGLDVDSQLGKLNKAESDTLKTILAYNNLTDEEEILTILQQINHSDNKVEFLKSLLYPEQIQNYMFFQKGYLNNRDKIKKEIAEIKTTNSFEKLILTLEIIRKYSY